MTIVKKEKTPITLLCGYLGAGKTTLLNRVLNNQQGYKVAVIVNDIGEVNVDASLIAKGGNITDTSDIVPLTNGCICCTLKSQMATNIEKMIKTGKYDYILIEASGVCEPMPIAQELELIKNGILDNVVGVVDASRLVDEFAGGENLLKKDQIGEEDIESLLIQQIEFCSTLIINKIDLVSESDLAKVRKVVQALHPGVHVIETSHGDVPVKDILATGSFDFDEVYGAAGWCKAGARRLKRASSAMTRTMTTMMTTTTKSIMSTITMTMMMTMMTTSMSMKATSITDMSITITSTAMRARARMSTESVPSSITEELR